MNRPNAPTSARVVRRSTPLNDNPRHREQELRLMPLAPEPTATSFFAVMLLPPALVSLWALLDLFS